MASLRDGLRDTIWLYHARTEATRDDVLAIVDEVYDELEDPGEGDR